MPTTPPGRRREIAQCQCAQSKIGSEGIYCRQDRQAVPRPMPPRRTHLVGNTRSPNVGSDANTLGVECDFLSAGIRFFREPERDHLGTTIASNSCEPVIMRVIAIENGNAARSQTLEYLRFRVGDRLHRTEELEMSGLDSGHDRNVRPNEDRQWANFASVVHADLKHPKPGVLG